ncbi:MAG: phosphate signaling complex protein PhoU [Gammaproteobacteria bacterium]|nr:phosphate signaling complex protein PhoU [Gammaproteobacteria bacterium]
MTHYEERLDKDLTEIRGHVATMAGMVETMVSNAMQALQSGDTALAAETVISDHAVNRMMRSIDDMCHRFIAVHLPSAGHMRLISSVIRANIELERVGDYAVTISREALQFSEPPSGSMAEELGRVAKDTITMLQQAIQALNNLDAGLARSTMVLEEKMEHNLDVVYAELMANPDRDAVKYLLAVFAVFTQLKRVADQAKNLCEEAVFAATGETKAPKTYDVLFVDNDNSCLSQMATAIAGNNYPGSGVFASAGKEPAAVLNTTMVAFLKGHGISLEGESPKALNPAPEALSLHHVIISLEGPVSDYFENIPFHTTPLAWDVGSISDSGDAQEVSRQLEEAYREIALRVRDLMETLRGEDAP